MVSESAARDELPDWASVLAVVAHPDDESFGLGALLDAFGRAGADVSVLCFTHGEASTLHGVAGDLRRLRTEELAEAAAALGLHSAVLHDHPDGALSAVAPEHLAAEVVTAVGQAAAQGMLVFDPSGVTGHPDHIAATEAALCAASICTLPVLGWTVPTAVADRLNDELGTGFLGHDPLEVDVVVELLGDTEHLRWLRARISPD